MQTAMMFDVESIGLYGEGFAVGYVVVDMDTCETLEEGLFACSPHRAVGTRKDRQWVEANVPAIAENCDNPYDVRTKFFDVWLKWRAIGCQLWTDCGLPVETEFINECIFDVADRKMFAPYPLFDLSTVLAYHGLDPIATYDRKENEIPAHHPLNDARQSARLLLLYWR